MQWQYKFSVDLKVTRVMGLITNHLPTNSADEADSDSDVTQTNKILTGGKNAECTKIVKSLRREDNGT